MTDCAEAHRQFDRYANGKIQTGILPAWTNVKGKVAWYVFQGSYRGLSQGWQAFIEKVRGLGPERLAGPPGDVYVCPPENHKESEEKLLTIMWAPIKD